MTLKPLFHHSIKFFFISICCMLPLYTYSYTKEEVTEKKAKVTMRMIGHELLKCVGDYQSLVLPIEKLEDQYKISFENNTKLDPDDVADIINRIMIKTETATNYIVEIEHCSTKELVHSFFVGPRFETAMIPCRGRKLPKDCYTLLVTLFEDTPDTMLAKISSNTALGLAKNKEENQGWIIFLILLPLIIGGIMFYHKSNTYNTPKNPNLLTVGASQFDKKNLVLSYKNQKTELSHKEGELLTLLHSKQNEPLEREIILKKVWGDEGDYIGRTLDVFISKLRKRLEDDTSVKIVNIRGIGYKLVTER